MASIQTAVELRDNFSTVVNTIIASTNMMISTMEEMNRSMNADVDTSSLEGIRDYMNQATIAANQLNNAIDDIDTTVPVSGQERLNESIRQGTDNANGLVGAIKGAVAAYATIETLKGAMNASDELIQTKSRLDMMNDGVQTTQDLLNMTYVAAQDARGEFGAMADVVARFGNNAKDAFDSSAEVVQFANLIQKSMTIAGASTQEAANAELQLSQALGSGVLRGDELNSIFEQAPNLIQNIADYLDVPIGKIREMAQDGQLSADVVKAAIFAATDDINTKFDSMPMTWGQVWTSMQNTATMAFQPVLERINEIANSEGFQTFVNVAINDLAILAGYVLEVFDIMGSVGSFIMENWSMISPVVYAVVAALAMYAAYMGIVNAVNLVSNGIKIVMCLASYAHAAATGAEVSATAAATAAQYGFNTALLACPITWIILLIIALIAVVIAVANYIANLGGTATSAFGVVCGGVNVVIQFFKNLGLEVANIALGIGNAIAALGSNIMTAFHNAISSVQSWWYDLLSTAMSVIESICSALNKLPFVDFDYSGITSAANDYAAKSAEAANNKQDYKSVSEAFKNGSSTFNTFENGWASNAYKDGAKWGDGVSNKVTKAFNSKSVKIPQASDYSSAIANGNNSAAQTAANTGNTANNTAKVADAVAVTAEDLKYLRDMAETETVNRYTTASITVNQTNHNTVNNEMDLDGVTEHLRSTMEEQMAAAAEGVH